MKKKWLIIIIAYVALLLVCISVIYIVPSVRGLLDTTYVTKYGTISIDDDVRAYIVRDEKVYVAKYEGDLQRNAETGDLMKSGAKVVEITPAEDDYGELIEGNTDVGRKYRAALETLGENVTLTSKGKSKVAGYVSYRFDGSEERMSTSHLTELTEKELKDFSSLSQIDVQNKHCNAGEPVYKIVPNRKWYLVFFIDTKNADKYYSGRTVYVDVEGEQVPVSVYSVDAIGKDGKPLEDSDYPADAENAPDYEAPETSGKSRVILTCKMFNGELISERKVDTVVTVASASGLVLKDSSIVDKDGQKGVFVKNKLGEHVFTPISIKADNGEECVAYSDIYVDDGGNFVETIGTYDEIVESPDEEDINSLKEEK